MKKTFLFLLMTLMVSWTHCKAQVGGNDYIIMLDNGASTTEQNFIDMRRGAVKLIEQLMMCNPTNRISVVHYGAGKYGNTSGIYAPTIYIESDFTSDHSVILNIERRLDFGDHFNEALGLTANALDGSPDINIISPQTTLHTSQPLKVIVFTDAERNTGALNGSYLVNYGNTTLNSAEAFKNVLSFKIDRGAQFTMIHANTNSVAVRAAASIASAGGSYMGPLETNIADPDYGILPRLYYNRPNGFETGMDINYWKDLAANLCASSGWANLKFKYEPGYCISGPAEIAGSYSLPAGSVVQDLRIIMQNITTGDMYPVLFNPLVVNDTFSYSLQTSDFAPAVNAGATGKHKLKLLIVYTYGGVTYNTYSWNNYPYFDYDIDLDCVTKMATKSLYKEDVFKLTPNPTHGLFKIILKDDRKSGRLSIIDLSGNVVYNKIYNNEKEITVDLSSQKEGVYIVKIVSDKNETYTQKIIKN